MRSPARVLVTGGASGIGAAIVRRFVDDGARVAVLDRDRTAVERSRDDGPAEVHLLGDVADPTAVEAAFAELDAHWGEIDVLFNNAGVSERSGFLETPLALWQRALATNLTGTFLVSQQAARRMSVAGGVIVNIASVSGMVGMPGYCGYNVSKAGVIELTKTMALELAPMVRVNAICPGYVLTPMQEQEYTVDELRACGEKVPLGRLGRPAEVAALGAYLASDDAAFATGHAFVLDGGETAGGLASA